MRCCCSSTCSRRNSISCSSRVRLRSFREVCRFRDACADSFSFWAGGREPRRLLSHVCEDPLGAECGLWDTGREGGGRGDGHLVPKLEECTAAEQPSSRQGCQRPAPGEGWAGPGRGGRPHPALRAGQGSRERARLTPNYTLAPGPVRARGEGHSPLSLSLLSCKMGVTDTTLDEEPQSVL